MLALQSKLPFLTHVFSPLLPLPFLSPSPPHPPHSLYPSLLFTVQGTKSRALQMLGKYSTAELPFAVTLPQNLVSVLL